MSNTPTLGDLLAMLGGTKTAAPVQPEPAKTAAPVKVEPAKVEPAKVAAAEPAKTETQPAKPAAQKTAAQLALAQQGVHVDDPAMAEAMYASAVKQAEAQKTAELQKFAAEMEARGALMYRGMQKEALAISVVEGEIQDPKDLVKLAAYVGLDPREILTLAREKRARADGAEAAMANDVFFSGMLGSAARENASQFQQAANRAQSTVEFQPGVEAKAPVSGPDAKLMGFTEAATIPGNPGLNNGQQVNQGKGS
jgi:hypothetical protein